MAGASGVVELDDEEVLLFIEGNETANTMRKTKAISLIVIGTKFAMRISRTLVRV
jgi:hypothetical protein